MNTDIKNRPVGEIVSENYHAAGVFREFGIDFCCGGHKTLLEVTEKRGIDSRLVESKLEEIFGQSSGKDDNYSEWEPGFLIDYIINTHHKFVRNKTDEISAYAAKVAKVHGENHPENIEIFRRFLMLSDDLIKHLEEEENTVFPLIKQIYREKSEGKNVDKDLLKELRKELSQMVDDHEGAGGMMAEINELSHRFTPPQDACATYRILYKNLEGFEEDLHKHVHLENNILFKKAEMLLN
ncbi:MAG: iron-sulfur cluster repair di-iron protein [Balneolaceae bacterium]